MNTRALLLDIEGTTTSIAFVYDVLFPYARSHARGFLEAHWGEPAVQQDVAEIRAQAERDLARGLEGVVLVPESDEAAIDGLVENVLWQMDNDRKTTGLKSLQGKIWRDGYESGQLKAHVFEDVRPAFERWTEAGLPIFIYSSGSIAAQKLLFTHSEAGNLTEFIRDYFDTTTGPKKESESYRQIASQVGFTTHEMLFATDNIDEANAARAADVKVVLMSRPGNPDPGPNGFDTHDDFTRFNLA